MGWRRNFNTGTLTITNCTISGNSSDWDGAGILNTGILTITNCTITGNNSEWSGAGIYNTGTLDLTTSIVSNNHSSYSGGGISNQSGTVEISDTTFSGNDADNYGGAISNYGSLVVSDSLFTQNSANYEGGAISHQSGSLEISLSTISENDSGFHGGGINNSGTLFITQSTVSGNIAGYYGGGIYNDGTLTIFQSTISNNAAIYYGGGIFSYGITSLTNSTVSGNKSDHNGGGIANQSGTLTLVNSTISGNSAGYNGGGIQNYGTLNFSNTIIANSTKSDCYSSSGTIGTNIHNLVENGNCSPELSGDPKLDALADNGGATQTHALLDGSTAIDFGDSATCTATDQRGVTRIIGNGCDIGAYEAGYPMAAPFVVVNKSIPTDNAVLDAIPENLQIVFNKEVLHDESIFAADNPANYLLVSDGVDNVFDTLLCSAGLMGDDKQYPVGPVTYDLASNTAFVTINGGKRLPNDNYRLFVCGTTSITDLFGLKLNEGTQDTSISFMIRIEESLTLPTTGFSPGDVTLLPIQSANNEYASTDLSMEIPVLGVNTSIVGVPQTVDGWDVTWLSNKIGYLEGTAFPTRVGNTVLTGHVWDADNTPGVFANLKILHYGDQIIIHAWGEVYTYEVRENFSVSPTNIDSVIKHEVKDWVTLITCSGYEETTGKYKERTVIRAVLVSVLSED